MDIGASECQSRFAACDGFAFLHLFLLKDAFADLKFLLDPLLEPNLITEEFLIRSFPNN
jgi:hypothetical protein